MVISLPFALSREPILAPTARLQVLVWVKRVTRYPPEQSFYVRCAAEYLRLVSESLP